MRQLVSSELTVSYELPSNNALIRDMPKFAQDCISIVAKCETVVKSGTYTTYSAPIRRGFSHLAMKSRVVNLDFAHLIPGTSFA
jgi:hypothetical protein